MGIDNAAALAVLALVALGLILLGAALLRRRAPAPPPDPSAALLQQQVTRLAEQVAHLSSQVPKEVGSALAQVMGQVTARLSENAQNLQRATADTGKLIADVSVRLGDLHRSSQQILDLGQDIRGLQQIFPAPKIRGGLGEIALGALLQQVFPAENFELQHTFQDGLTVDAVLRLPGGLVPIDSKFPLSGFRQLLEAQGPEQRERARRVFARDVRRHIDDIADKYVRPGEGTLDFALMYIPAENVFYELIARDDAVGEEDINAHAVKRRLIPLSPNSIYAYLQAIAYGLMGLKIEQRAREILKGLQQLQGDFGIFHDQFLLGQRHLKNAQNAFAEAGDRGAKLGDKIQQFANVAQDPRREEPASSPTLQAGDRVRPRSIEQ